MTVVNSKEYKELEKLIWALREPQRQYNNRGDFVGLAPTMTDNDIRRQLLAITDEDVCKVWEDPMPFTIELDDFERPVIISLIEAEIDRLLHEPLGEESEDQRTKKIDQLRDIRGRL